MWQRPVAACSQGSLDTTEVAAMYCNHFVSSRFLTFVSFFFSLFAVLSASAKTIHVPGDHATIQGAIDATVNGDMVLVSDGTYTENINFNGKAITVKSVNGASVTIIDGNAVNTVVTFSSQETSDSVLDGFTIRNGAVAVSSTTGSGIYVADSSPTIKNNIITDNSGCQGSGIDVYFGSPLIQGNTITNNKQGGCSGGTGGGGILIGGASQPQILNNTISSNTTGVDGGGISLFAAGTPTISGNIISGNTAAGVGGGIAMANDSDAIVTDNVFTGNTAYQGGGIAALVPSGSPGPSVVNNTFFANIATTDGSEFYLNGFYSQTNLFNNIFWGSANLTAVLCDTGYSSDPPIFEFNDTYNPQGTALGGACIALRGTNHNISVDPLFVNAPSDLRLKPTSPAIDVGSNSAPHIPQKDIAGNDRILAASGQCNPIVDLGAYELGQSSSLTLNPLSIPFPAQLVGSTSSALASTITNNGAAAVTVCSIAATGDFAQTNNCAASILAKASCSVSITFTPTAHGQRNGFVQIITSDGGSPQTISLFGTAVEPIFSATPTMYRFPASQQVGTTSPPTTVTVTNNGDGPLHISNSTTSSDFGQTNNCPDQLSPSTSCDYLVTFSPTAAGERSGFLTITDNAGPHPIQLYGAGNDFSLSAVNQGGTSATVAAGATANYMLEVVAANGFNSTVTLICTGAPSEAVCTIAPASITPTGTAAQFTVSITTTAPSVSGVPYGVFSPPSLWTALLATTPLLIFARRRAWVGSRLAYPALVAVLFLVIAWTTACGSKSSPPHNSGTPKGTYTLSVTGASNGVSRPLSLSLTVN
jgi:parallel beta-helix repeat protein